MEDENAGMPRWVKISFAVTVAIVVLFVVLLLSGQGHGPGRHMPSHGLGGAAAPSVGVQW